jgi:hypothetical protein
MQLSADLREFIELLNSGDVEYVIVGAHSLAYHGRPRYTGDLDILVRPSPANAAKLSAVLWDFDRVARWREPKAQRQFQDEGPSAETPFPQCFGCNPVERVISRAS